MLTALLLVAAASGPQVGDRVHVTGCDKTGKLTRPVVNLYELAPGGGMGKPVGTVLGSNQTKRWAGACAGELVIVRERATSEVAPFVRYRVETVMGTATGWLAEGYIGARFPVAQCGKAYADSPAAAAKCKP